MQYNTKKINFVSHLACVGGVQKIFSYNIELYQHMDNSKNGMESKIINRCVYEICSILKVCKNMKIILIHLNKISCINILNWINEFWILLANLDTVLISSFIYWMVEIPIVIRITFNLELIDEIGNNELCDSKKTNKEVSLA